MGNEVEASPERIRNHLRRPDADEDQLIMKPPLTPLIRQTPAGCRAGLRPVKSLGRRLILRHRALAGGLCRQGSFLVGFDHTGSDGAVGRLVDEYEGACRAVGCVVVYEERDGRAQQDATDLVQSELGSLFIPV